MTIPSASPPYETTPIVDPRLYRRHPLGLPAGSVRSVLALMVFGIYWGIILLPEDKMTPVPVYLYYLMFLILGHYFASQSRHAVDHTQPAPLHLPRGTARLLIVAGFIAVLGYGFYSIPDFMDRLKPDSRLWDQPFTPLVILGAFFLGILAQRLAFHVIGRADAVPSWVQDVQAWVSLLAVLGMCIEVIIRLVINPQLDGQQRSLLTWEMGLAGVVTFYFGARSYSCGSPCSIANRVRATSDLAPISGTAGLAGQASGSPAACRVCGGTNRSTTGSSRQAAG